MTTNEQIEKRLTTLEVGLFGVSGTDARGLAGEIADIKEMLNNDYSRIGSQDKATGILNTKVTALEDRCKRFHNHTGEIPKYSKTEESSKTTWATTLIQAITRNRVTTICMTVSLVAALVIIVLLKRWGVF